MLKKILFLLILSIILTSCGEIKEEKKVVKSYSTYEVKKGSVKSKNTYVGYTAGVNEVMLATKVPGRITYLAKKVGDKVSRGELLVSLDGAEAKSGYSTANNIINSLYNVREETAKAYDGQIGSVLAKIEQVKAGIKGATTGLLDTKKITKSQLETANSAVKKAEIALETAKTNLEETKNDLSSKKSTILSSGKSALTQSAILDKNIMDFADKLLGVTFENRKFNDKFEDYLGTKDTVQLKKTETLFLETKLIYDEFEIFYKNKVEEKKPSEKDIVFGLKLAKKLAEKEKILLKEIYTVIDNSIDNIYFSAGVMNEYKQNISKMGSDLENTLLSVDGNFMLGINGTLENLENFESGKNKGISLLEKQVELAKAGLNTAKKTYYQYEAMSSGEVNGVITKKEIAEKQLLEAMEGLKAIKAKKQASLKEIDAKIVEAKGGKDTARIMIDSGKVISNISGIITMKMADEGEVVNAGMPIYKIINNSRLAVKTSVPYEIYKNLKKGDKVNLKIEGVLENVFGTISLISKSSNSFTKKYDIKINIKNKNGIIPIGAMVKIELDGKPTKNNKTMIIPNKAIISKFMLPSVFILENNKAILKDIKIINMGEKEAEIIGLKSGDIIIINGKENIFDGEELFNK